MDFFEITDKEELLTRSAGDYERLKSLLDGLSDQVIDFVPDIPNAWSIREHIAHLMDTEIRAFVRYRNAVTDKGIRLVLGGGDVDSSNILLAYASQDVKDSLEIIRLLRRITVSHVSAMTDEEMKDHYIEHPDLGKTNLKMILSIYTQHIDKHIEFLQRNMSLFEAKRQHP